MAPGTDAILGMDLICLGDFLVANGEGHTTSSFQIPGRQPNLDLRNIAKPQAPVRVRPNDPCPCGSGKKHKHCHGQHSKR